MDTIVKYMIERKWADDEKTDRKVFLWKLAQKSKEEKDVSHKIGGMLIYNQLIEEFLKDITELSVNYIKAEIWPADVCLKLDFSKMTFGKLINEFKQYATIEHNREILLEYLHKYNVKRNEVVHHLFGIEDLEKLAIELDEYALLADEIVHLLVEYDNSVCEKFCDLDTRVDFNDFVDD